METFFYWAQCVSQQTRVLSSRLLVNSTVLCPFSYPSSIFYMVFNHRRCLSPVSLHSYKHTSIRIPSRSSKTMWDILWSCLATILACSWVSVYPNIPGPIDSSWRIILRHLEHIFWLYSEMIISWALQQWLGAQLHTGKLSIYNASNLSTNN